MTVPITVPLEFYSKAFDVFGPGWTDAYLSGATLKGDRLLPRTVTAWERLRDSADFTDLLRVEGVTLLKPPPFVAQHDVNRGEWKTRAFA